MFKLITFFVLITVLGVSKVSAQRDTILTYMRIASRPYEAPFGVPVKTRDSADFIRMIISLDTSVDKFLFPVSDFYLNGKPKLSGTSTIGTADINLQGHCLEYYPNGLKKRISNFENSNRVGDLIEYYPNGKFYVSGTYHQGRLKLFECRDSTGKLLTENGNGIWIKFGSDFKKILEEGPVENGIEQGEWKGYPNDSVYYVCNYYQGTITSGTSYDKKGNQHQFTHVDVAPEFNGGDKALGEFIYKRLHYPIYDLEHNIQGTVMVAFKVETDGTLNNIHIAEGREKYMNEEALRLVKTLPQWKPGSQYGITIPMIVSIPITFRLITEKRFNFRASKVLHPSLNSN